VVREGVVVKGVREVVKGGGGEMVVKVEGGEVAVGEGTCEAAEVGDCKHREMKRSSGRFFCIA
jgi:hypothetical protein